MARNIKNTSTKTGSLLLLIKSLNISGQSGLFIKYTINSHLDKLAKVLTKYIYLVQTSINFADLKTKLKGIEENVALAESNGFQHQCSNLSVACKLIQTLGIENDEVQKDELRQNLNSAEAYLNNKCAEWLKIEHENLKQKINVLETLHLQVPTVLDQQSGHPLTEFSQILFQSVQLEVRLAYTKVSDQIRQIQKTCA